MKRHWGDRREFHDGKQKMSLYQSDSGEERDVRHRHRLGNVTFKGTLSENISLSSHFRMQQPLLPVVLGGSKPQLTQLQERAIFCSTCNYGGVKHVELTAGHRPSASSSLEHLEPVSLNFSPTVDSYLLRDGRSNLEDWTVGQSESVQL